jgi:uncharacterized protein (TIGR02246 family)
MSLDLPDQLREYGDHFRSGLPTVEMEDIFTARTAVASLEVATATPPWRRVLVLIAAFVATIVVIGGSLGIGLLLKTEPGEPGTAAAPTAGDGGGGEIWALVIAVGALLLVAVVVLVMQGRTEIVGTNGGVMQTLERQEVEVSPRPRSPSVLIAGLLVVAAGAMGWWLGSTSNTAAEVPEIVLQTNDAWVDGDPDGVAALYTDDGVYTEKPLEAPALSRDESWTGREAIHGHVRLGLQYADFDEMRVDTVMVVNDLIVFEWTASGMSSNTFRESMTPFETSGMTVFEMEDGLIARSFIYYNSGEVFN